MGSGCWCHGQILLFWYSSVFLLNVQYAWCVDVNILKFFICVFIFWFKLDVVFRWTISYCKEICCSMKTFGNQTFLEFSNCFSVKIHQTRNMKNKLCISFDRTSKNDD